MSNLEIALPTAQEAVLERFITICRQDERFVVAILSGSNAQGKADAFSDLDLGLITTSEAYEAFIAKKGEFIQQLGEMLFFEDFDNPNMAHFIFRSGVEGELAMGREDALDQLHSGPSQVLLDKKGLLQGDWFTPPVSPPSSQVDILRRLIYGFHHDLSHLITALGRGQLWWAAGQIEMLRGMCVSLARLQHDFSSFASTDEPYFKVDKDMPVELLAPLQKSYVRLDLTELRQSTDIILRFYREVAQSLAAKHGLDYPEELEHLMLERLSKI
jgi:predicted nucleotidyltransferase